MTSKLLGTLAFGEWLPDLPPYKNPGSPNVKNAMWVDRAYQQALGFSSLGVQLPARCQGAYAAEDAAAAIHIYAGTATQLEEYAATGFVNRSAGGGAPYNASSFGYWKFAEYSSQGYPSLLLATDYVDALQSIVPGGAAFAAVAGAPPNASQVGVIGQFVVLGDTNDGVNGHVPFRVQWCAIGNPTSWIYGTLAAQQAQAGVQYLQADYGPITHISNGGLQGLVFQQRGITRMVYTGDDAIFFFDTFEKQRGALFPRACVQLGNNVYFIAEDGFCVTDGQTVKQIGHGKVDSTFMNSVNQGFSDRVTGSLDPIKKQIIWAYCTAGNSTGIPDAEIAYNYAEDRFAPQTQSISTLFVSRSPGYTMDTLNNVNTNLDLITPTLDSPYWEGGNIQIGAFDGNNNFGGLAGAPLTATIDTLEDDPNPGGMTYVDGVRPVASSPVSGTLVPTVALLYKNLENAAYSTLNAAAQNARTGRCDLRKKARYFRASATFAGGFTAAIGVDLYGHAAGNK